MASLHLTRRFLGLFRMTFQEQQRPAHLDTAPGMIFCHPCTFVESHLFRPATALVWRFEVHLRGVMSGSLLSSVIRPSYLF
jgi:hypothetical protein